MRCGANVACWDDDQIIREKAIRKKLNITKVTIRSLSNCNYLVLSPGINHKKKNPHKAIKIAKKKKY